MIVIKQEETGREEEELVGLPTVVTLLRKRNCLQVEIKKKLTRKQVLWAELEVKIVETSVELAVEMTAKRQILKGAKRALLQLTLAAASD